MVFTPHFQPQMVFHGVNTREHTEIGQGQSSSTEALESDHARYVMRKIVQHAKSMATSTRSLPNDSPFPYFQPIEKGYMSEGLTGRCVCTSLCGSIRTHN